MKKKQAVEGAEKRGEHRVSVVIVNYNSGPLLVDAVAAVLTTAVISEIFVSDNGSSDGSVAGLRRVFGNRTKVHIIENGWNMGFSRACNIAAARASGDFLLFLNPDCIVQPGTLDAILKAMTALPVAGMAGCLIRNPDNSEQAGCRRAIPTPWRSFVRVFRLNKLFPGHPRFRTFLLHQEPLPDRPTSVEAISGAFMLVRRQALEQVGLLDEGYFLHCEDLDWCMRFRQAGWEILFVPDAVALHYKGGCSGGRRVFVEWHKHKGMIRFYRKFFRHQYPLVLMPFVIVAVWVRFGLLAVRALVQRERPVVACEQTEEALAMKLAAAPRPPVLLRAHTSEQPVDTVRSRTVGSVHGDWPLPPPSA